MTDETEGYSEQLEPIDEENGARERWRRRARNTFLVALLILIILILIDMVVVRGPGEFEFARRNIECLRCHTELLDQFRMSTVHQPFRLEQCTSCHTPHGEKVRSRSVGGDFSAWEWLHRLLDRFYLDILWRVFAGHWLVDDAPPGGITEGESTRKGPDSELVTDRTKLCWTCHQSRTFELFLDYQHEPFAQGFCTSCHHPHASNYTELLHGTERDLCPSCHPVAAELAQPDVHQPFGAIRCLDCHKPHSSDWKGVLVTEQRTLCFTCHPSVAALTGLRVQHEPFDVDPCTSCHKPHSSQAMPLLVDFRPRLCYGCHPEVETDFRRVSRHPIDRIGCEDCHVPHASEYDAVLHTPQPRLCFDCHEAIEDDLVKPIRHAPFSDSKKCTACHVPHGSNADPLLIVSEPPLCYRCHPASASDFELPSAHPVGINLPCTGCHEAHASFFDPLLVATGRTLCYRCHGYVSATFEISLHTRIECLDCHLHHGSVYEPILQKRNPELCLGCHPPYADYPYYHPTHPRWYDVNSQKPLTCSSSCHNPHGSINTVMLRVPYGQRGFGTDYVCLLCHDGVGVWY